MTSVLKRQGYGEGKLKKNKKKTLPLSSFYRFQMAITVSLINARVNSLLFQMLFSLLLLLFKKYCLLNLLHVCFYY